MNRSVDRWLERATRAVLLIGARNLTASERGEIVATVRRACMDSLDRRGWTALCKTAAAELLDIATISLRRRIGWEPSVTAGGTPPAPVISLRGSQIVINDFRRALTRLRSNVGPLSLSIGMLALAIGATTAMFTILDALMLHPVPFRDADRLTAVVVGVNNGRGYLQSVPPPVLRSWQTSGAFSSVEGAMQSSVIVDTGSDVIAKPGARITPGLLGMLGIRPLLGRAFTEDEGRAGTDDRILLSEELWQTLFNRDPGIVATSVLGLVAAAITGIAPAWLATRVDAAQSLRLIGYGGSGVRSRRRLSRALLVGEMALATTLLVGAMLLIRTFVNLTQADRGLNVDGVVTGWVSLPEFAFPDRPGRMAFAGTLEERLRKLPGVEQVSLSGGLPPSSGSIYFGKVRTDSPDPREVVLSELNVYNVSSRFFELFGIPLVAGRSFSEPSALGEVILGERFARMLWPHGQAVGRTFRFDGGASPQLVVGVVGEIRNPSLDPRLDRPEMYFPLVVERDGRSEASAFGSGQIFLAVRCTVCPSLPEMRAAIRGVSAQVVIASLGPLEEEYIKDLARPRAAAILAAAFAALALLASAGGLFGVLTAAVAQRRREFGIRVALGIDPGRLRRLVVVDAARLAATGFAFGAIGAWTLSRSLVSLTFGVSSSDPRSWGIVGVALGCCVVAAAWRPAAQAARVDPVSLLRQE